MQVPDPRLPARAAKVAGFALEQDWNLVRTRAVPTPLRPDGRLELRSPATPADRLVRPTVFLGRGPDGRLHFLCEVLDS